MEPSKRINSNLGLSGSSNPSTSSGQSVNSYEIKDFCNKALQLLDKSEKALLLAAPVSKKPEKLTVADRLSFAQKKQPIQTNAIVTNGKSRNPPEKAPATKPSMAVLQEMLCKIGAKAEYKLLATYGPKHEPSYYYGVSSTVNGNLMIAHATGNSKKQAKHAAAKSLIERLNEEADENNNNIQSQTEKKRLSLEQALKSIAQELASLPQLTENTSHTKEAESKKVTKQTVADRFNSANKTGFNQNAKPDKSKQQPQSHSDSSECSRTSSNLTLKASMPVLQNYLSQKGTKPVYTLVLKEGSEHQPLYHFNVSCKVDGKNMSAMGIGVSKQQAKHAAAKTLLKEIGVEIEESGVTENHIRFASNETLHSLQKEWKARLTNRMESIFASAIEEFRDLGQTVIKKIEKELEAENMLHIWKSISNDNLSDTHTYTLDDEIESSYSASESSSDSLCIDGLEEYFKDLRSSKNKFQKNINEAKEYFKALRVVENKKFNPVRFLELVSKERNFAVKYICKDEKSHLNFFQCFVELSVVPVAVCHGLGETEADAKADAAFNALEYLKLRIKQ